MRALTCCWVVICVYAYMGRKEVLGALKVGGDFYNFSPPVNTGRKADLLSDVFL